jgi:TetR/AcrR family transcriptional repressor of bet genes
MLSSLEAINWVYNQSMGRPSLRDQRRGEVARALVRTLGAHGRIGATIAAVAGEAGIAPGLVHHYFSGKQDLYEAAIRGLLAEFRRRIESVEVAAGADPLEAYITAALALDERSDVAAARAWVGIFAESLGDPALFARMRRMIDGEVAYVEARARGTLSTQDASAVVAFVVGALVFGAFAPRKAAGFAAPSLRRLLAALTKTVVPVLLVLAVGLTAGTAVAQADVPASSRGMLSWEAPASCPTEEAVRAQIVSLLTDAPGSGPLVRARSIVVREPDGRWHLDFRLEVDGREETRELDAASCGDLATATATLVAIAVSPGQASAPVDAAGPLEAVVPVSPPGPEALPAPPTPPQRAALPTTPSTTVHDEAHRGESAAPAAPPVRRFAVAALLGGTSGAVGNPAFAVGGSFAYLTGRTRWEAGFLWSPLESIDNSAAGVGGVFTMGVVEARACYLLPFQLPAHITFGPCVNAEGGYLYARGEGALDLSESKTRGWAGVGAGGILTIGGPTLAFRLQLEGVVPLASTHFVVDGGGEVETPWPIVPRALVGGEVHFP